MKTGFFLVFAFVVLSDPAHAAAGQPLDLQHRYGKYYITFDVNTDGTLVESREWSMTVLKEAAVDWAKRTSVSYSTSVQKVEVISAYTSKADGRRVDARKDNYQIEINRGNGADGPAFSDTSTLTVIFPDVAVGDTVVFAYRLAQSEPLFPKQVSISQTFPRQSAFDDVRVRISYPASMWTQYESRKMTVRGSSETGDRKMIEWGYANPQPVKDERRDYSVFEPDKEAGYVFSTFRTYAEIAFAYGARALPKAAVSERIKTHAAEIVKDKTTPRDQARALYDWVATNISYAGNCIGTGAVVPRDLSFVLDNRMGDCKDHATLLQALLAARGIESTQALVNAGAVYRLPKIPVVSNVNHVINYIPSLDLYLDSTSDSTPYGMLPSQIEDKPVLLVEGFRDGTRTPISPNSRNRETIKSVLKISPEGSIAGTVDVGQKGHVAAVTRAWARKTTKDWEDDFVKNMLQQQGALGYGQLEKDDPTGLENTYHYKVKLDMEKFTKIPGPAAFFIYPLVPYAGSIQNAMLSSMNVEKEADVTCSGGDISEEYIITLPAKLKVLAMPDDAKIANGVASYNATYRLKGNVLTVKRHLDDRTPGNVCSPKIFLEYSKFAEQVMDNLKSQVLYK